MDLNSFLLDKLIVIGEIFNLNGMNNGAKDPEFKY